MPYKDKDKQREYMTILSRERRKRIRESKAIAIPAIPILEPSAIPAIPKWVKPYLSYYKRLSKHEYDTLWTDDGIEVHVVIEDDCVVGYLPMRCRKSFKEMISAYLEGQYHVDSVEIVSLDDIK
jgi:hypothetical protein